MPLRQTGAVVGLNARRPQRREAPAGRDQLLGRRRITTGRRCAGRGCAGRPRGRAARFGQRIRSDCFGRQRAAAEHDHHGHALRIHRRHERHADLDADRGIRAVVDAADELPAHDTSPADLPFARRRNRPCDVRHALRHAPDDLALEVLDNLGSTLISPQVRGRDLRAAAQRQWIGQPRIRIRFRFVVIGGVRRSRHRPSARAAAVECRAAASMWR